CRGKARTSLPEGASRSRSAPCPVGPRPPTATTLPLGEKAAVEIHDRLPRLALPTSLPPGTSEKRSVPSQPPQARTLPSGEKARAENPTRSTDGVRCRNLRTSLPFASQ